MSVDRIFIVYMVAVGTLVGMAVVQWPDLQTARLPPYVWVLALMLLFEAAVFVLRGGPFGSALSMLARIVGFAIAALPAIAIPALTGASRL